MVQCENCSAELLPCPQLLGNASARSRCAKAQGWTRKRGRHTWNCPACTARYRQVPESVPYPESICFQSHGVVAPCRDLPEPSHGYPAPSHVEGARRADPAPSHVDGGQAGGSGAEPRRGCQAGSECVCCFDTACALHRPACTASTASMGSSPGGSHLPLQHPLR